MVTPLPRHRVQLVAQATTTLDRLSGGRVVLALGLGVDSYGEYSLFDEPAADDKARAAALDAGIELLVPMLEGGPVAAARRPGDDGGRRAGAARADLDRRASPATRPVRAGSPATASTGWRSSATTSGRRRPSSPRSPPAALAPGSLDVALVGGTHPDPAALAAAGATWCIPEILPGRDRGRRAQPGSDAALSDRRRAAVAQRERLVARALAAELLELGHRLLDRRRCGRPAPTSTRGTARRFWNHSRRRRRNGVCAVR